ncbi:MAG: hypothetical protein LBT36_04615 [Oscillospiraceae bacterium]|nr:hypothetical protein [Oscillospiraceae bacterium]
MNHRTAAAEPGATYVIGGVTAVVERVFPDESAAEPLDTILARLICEDAERDENDDN